MISPLSACNNGNNDESNNPPETPKQTNFYEEKLTIYNPKFYCYEQFDNIDDATAYAKTWREDYELFIPDIEEADSLRIDFITYQSREEKETFLHKIEFEYTNADPYYLLTGETMVYKEGELDKTEFYLETRELIEGPNRRTNYQYYYKEDGSIGSTYDLVSFKGGSIGIKQNNFVLLHIGLSINKTETKTLEEIKALTLDNIVPVEEQKHKDKEISTNYSLGINVDIGSSMLLNQTYEYYSEFESNVKSLNKKNNISCFAIKVNGQGEYVINLSCNRYYYNLDIKNFIYVLNYMQLNEKEVRIDVASVLIPNEILEEEIGQTTFILGQETDYGYNFSVNNGKAKIFTGQIRAEDKTFINLEEIEQKILSNIELIKGE